MFDKLLAILIIRKRTGDEQEERGVTTGDNDIQRIVRESFADLPPKKLENVEEEIDIKSYKWNFPRHM